MPKSIFEADKLLMMLLKKHKWAYEVMDNEILIKTTTLTGVIIEHLAANYLLTGIYIAIDTKTAKSCLVVATEGVKLERND